MPEPEGFEPASERAISVIDALAAAGGEDLRAKVVRVLASATLYIVRTADSASDDPALLLEWSTVRRRPPG